MPRYDSPITTRVVDNATFLPHIVDLIAEGHTITLPLRGRSMRPFLEDGRDKALLSTPTDIAIGDAVLAELSPGHYVLHRVVAITPTEVRLLIDGNLTEEHCRPEDIRAKAIGFFRKGRTKADYTDGRKWKVYSALWMFLRPVRRYLLFLAHPHVPQRLKKRLTI